MTAHLKTCKKCGVIKPLTEYHNKVASYDGKEHACKSCKKAAHEARKSVITAKPEPWFIFD